MYLLADGHLDGGGVVVEALQQLPSGRVHVKVGRLLAEHRLQVALPQLGGLPRACSTKEAFLL